MDICIALFRGINVGGNRQLPMAELRSMLEKHGCAEVRTYIQSGNAIFCSKAADYTGLAKRIGAAVARPAAVRRPTRRARRGTYSNH